MDTYKYIREIKENDSVKNGKGRRGENDKRHQHNHQLNRTQKNK